MDNAEIILRELIGERIHSISISGNDPANPPLRRDLEAEMNAEVARGLARHGAVAATTQEGERVAVPDNTNLWPRGSSWTSPPLNWHHTVSGRAVNARVGADLGFNQSFESEYTTTNATSVRQSEPFPSTDELNEALDEALEELVRDESGTGIRRIPAGQKVSGNRLNTPY